MTMQVWSLASLSGLGMDVAVSCGVGHRCSSGPSWLWLWLWLWRRPAAVTLIWPLAWECSYAMGAALKRQKKKKKKKIVGGWLAVLKRGGLRDFKEDVTFADICCDGFVKKAPPWNWTQNLWHLSLTFLLYRKGGCRGSERLSASPKVTQPVGGRGEDNSDLLVQCFSNLLCKGITGEPSS